ncbi:MAG: hypothetical protein ABR861_12320 [Terriglobales bacterium]
MGIFLKQTQGGILHQSFGVGAFFGGDLRKLRFRRALNDLGFK